MSDKFEGVTAKDCCNACTDKRCAITENQFCGHPFKSSHPGAGAKVKERIAAVKKIIAMQKAAAA